MLSLQRLWYCEHRNYFSLGFETLHLRRTHHGFPTGFPLADLGLPMRVMLQPTQHTQRAAHEHPTPQSCPGQPVGQGWFFLLPQHFPDPAAG